MTSKTTNTFAPQVRERPVRDAFRPRAGSSIAMNDGRVDRGDNRLRFRRGYMDR